MILFCKSLQINGTIRQFSSGLKSRLKELIPHKRTKFNKLKQLHGDKIIDNVSIAQVLGGMRGIKSLYWDTSLLNSEKGILFNGLTIPELRQQLPTLSNKPDSEPMVESMIWFLLTKEIPTHDQIGKLSIELQNRSHLDDIVSDMIRNFPKDMHPMTQLSSAIMAMQTKSKFSAAYNSGIKKGDYWMHCYDDIIDIIAKLPRICSLIYNNKYDREIKEYDNSLDYAGNFCQMLGFDNEQFHNLMRLYLIIHSDHEGGNASAHTCRLVGSTLADPYLSLAASMNALAGPLHGLANQEVLKWIIKLQKSLEENGEEISSESIEKFVWKTLDDGQVIPGYGHAVLRITDPRYSVQRDFALKNLKDDELFKLVNIIYEIMPGILMKHGKTKNPYPNVDFHSGILLKHYGLHEYEYYTVLFGLGRAIGVLSELFWDRALNIPLERPKSLNLKEIQDLVYKEIYEESYNKYERM
tara:strand:+ start:2535 stop:3938 length:1404 start_codon:yes stop_codon:yes gene_type:complete